MFKRIKNVDLSSPSGDSRLAVDNDVTLALLRRVIALQRVDKCTLRAIKLRFMSSAHSRTQSTQLRNKLYSIYMLRAGNQAVSVVVYGVEAVILVSPPSYLVAMKTNPKQSRLWYRYKARRRHDQKRYRWLPKSTGSDAEKPSKSHHRTGSVYRSSGATSVSSTEMLANMAPQHGRSTPRTHLNRMDTQSVQAQAP